VKKHLSVIYFFLTIIGVFGVIVTLGYDYFRPGEPDFGKYQFMGFVGSIISNCYKHTDFQIPIGLMISSLIFVKQTSFSGSAAQFV
jgi:hypothetical protein